MHPSAESEPIGKGSRGEIVGAIPARFASTRLPGKVVRPIAGRPMIEHVYRRASQARGLDRVVVLTDDQRIAEVVAGFGGDFEMTPVGCVSGTDRIAHAARGWQAAAVVNIQGDEPLIEPEAVSRVAEHLATQPRDPVVTLAAEAEEADLDDPNVVKVVLDRRGYALYFSRSAIPHPRRSGRFRPLRHIGIYGYQLPALLDLAAHKPTPLEETESLEQLRALETGMAIRVLEVGRAWWGVDTMDDLLRVERFLSEEKPEESAATD